MWMASYMAVLCSTQPDHVSSPGTLNSLLRADFAHLRPCTGSLHALPHLFGNTVSPHAFTVDTRALSSVKLFCSVEAHLLIPGLLPIPSSYRTLVMRGGLKGTVVAMLSLPS